MKKLLSIFLTALLILGTVPTVLAQESTIQDGALVTSTQKFCDAVNQYIIDCGMEAYFLFRPDENGNKVMFTPETFKSQEVYLETTDFAIFNLHGVMPLSSQETIGDYTFRYNVMYDSTNPCGFCIYKNGKVYGIRDAVDKCITNVATLANVIPGTTKGNELVSENHKVYVKVNYTNYCDGENWIAFTNKPTKLKYGSEFTTILKAFGDKSYITGVAATMGRETVIDPIKGDDGTYTISIPFVTDDITIGALVNGKEPPNIIVGDGTMTSITTNLEHIKIFRDFGNTSVPVTLNVFNVFSPFDYKIVPEPGYEIVSLTAKRRLLSETGEYGLYEYPAETVKLDNNSYILPSLGEPVVLEGKEKKIPAKLSKSQLSLKSGETQTLSVINDTAKSWSISNKNVAIVNNGKVTGVGKGTAIITATLTTGEKLICKVKVVNSPKLTSSIAVLKSGATKTIKAVAGTVKSWTTSNKKVAVVKDGKITALDKGTATVTATLATGKKLSCKVTVTTAPKLSKTTVKVKKNGTATVKVIGKALSISNKYTNTKVAKITSKASDTTLKIKGLKKGEITLKIKINGVKTLSLKVKVK